MVDAPSPFHAIVGIPARIEAASAPLTLAALRAAAAAQFADVVALTRLHHNGYDEASWHAISDYRICLDALARTDKDFACRYVEADGQPRWISARHDARAAAEHLDRYASSYIYSLTLDALKREGRRYRPTVDAIVAAQGCDRDAAKNMIAMALKAAAAAEPTTSLVELYDRAFGAPSRAHCDHDPDMGLGTPREGEASGQFQFLSK